MSMGRPVATWCSAQSSWLLGDTWSSFACCTLGVRWLSVKCTFRNKLLPSDPVQFSFIVITKAFVRFSKGGYVSSHCRANLTNTEWGAVTTAPLLCSVCFEQGCEGCRFWAGQHSVPGHLSKCGEGVAGHRWKPATRSPSARLWHVQSLVVTSVASFQLIRVKVLRSNYNFPYLTGEETDSGKWSCLSQDSWVKGI